jgi:Cu(I)/Ag(I) efflux system membrane fusion protein/cobalt-zinc-cadmium efflux system membrane fusion protein
MKSDSEEKSSIVREGEIDLAAIDVNKDGKVYQDQMCWNVISDESGECPQCGMILKEVSLEKAKENLIKNKYQVK